MKIGLIGRTNWLTRTAEKLIEAGRPPVFILHGKAAEHDKTTDEDFQKLADRAGCPLYRAKTIDDELLSNLKSHNADIVLSVNWAFILDKDVIDAFPLGIVNAHAGDLPRYRGNACPNWAILNGEHEIGLCAQLMVPGEVDAGPILLQEKFPIDETSYIKDIYDWLDVKIPEILIASAFGLENKSLKPEPQSTNPDHILRCYPRRPEDAEIDWKMDAVDIHRLIRASGNPFNGAYSYYEGKDKIKILKASIHQHSGQFLAVPGQILYAHENKPVIACGYQSCLLIDEAEWDGMSTPEKQPLTYLSKHLRGRLFS